MSSELNRRSFFAGVAAAFFAPQVEMRVSPNELAEGETDRVEYETVWDTKLVDADEYGGPYVVGKISLQPKEK